MNRTCPHCQAPFLETQRFCRYCGYRLDEGVQDYVKTHTFGQTTSPAPQPAEFASGSPSWSPPMAAGTTSLREGARQSKFLYGLLALILLCALGAGIVGYVASSQRWAPVFSRQPVAAQPSYLGVYFGSGQSGGAFIDGIANEGGPADLAGLIGGDVIIEASGKPIHSNRDMRRVLASTPPGSKINITFLRDGQEMKTVLVTATRGDFPSRSTKKPHGFFGYYTGSLKRVPVPGTAVWGVRLDHLVRNGPAELAGIRQGDIVIEFNGHPVRTAREFRRQLYQTEPYSEIVVKVVRGGEEIAIPVKVGRNDG